MQSLLILLNRKIIWLTAEDRRESLFGKGRTYIIEHAKMPDRNGRIHNDVVLYMIY